MQDYSYLDKKYFIDDTVYNCPFCNRKNVKYNIPARYEFDWTDQKKCYVFLTLCSSCNHVSMHLSYNKITYGTSNQFHIDMDKLADKDIDSKIFYSVPTSFFVLDERIPLILRELITESEGCLKMNYLTGASTCIRKAIYELLVKENAQGDDYETRIKSLKKKYSNVDSSYFDILSHIQNMTSDKIHEQSWDKWDSKNLTLIIETLKSIIYDIYVLPSVKAERAKSIQKLKEDLVVDKKQEIKQEVK